MYMQQTNNTRVVFDEQLKMLIWTMKEEHADWMCALKWDDYDRLQITQKHIRDYFVTHQNQLNIDKGIGLIENALI